MKASLVIKNYISVGFSLEEPMTGIHYFTIEANLVKDDSFTMEMLDVLCYFMWIAAAPKNKVAIWSPS